MEDLGIDEIWSDDLLNRKSEARFLQDFLIKRLDEKSKENRTKSYVLSLDGSWGKGKTFFLERLHKQLTAEKFLSVYINAWKDDHAEDPMIAVMAAIDDELQKYLTKNRKLATAWKATKNSVGRIAITTLKAGVKKGSTKLLGEGADEIAEIIEDEIRSLGVESNIDDNGIKKSANIAIEKLIDQRADKALERFKSTKLSIGNFRANLTEFLRQFDNTADVKAPLFLLVDELDRCRPPYAIATLERIKHIFDVENIIFIVATDGDQLRHSIRAVYGNEFDSNRYLLRFFDRTYNFLQPSVQQYVEFLFTNHPIAKDKFFVPYSNIETVFFKVVNTDILSLRDIAQCYDYMRNIATMWSYRIPIHGCYMLALIVLFQQGRNVEFRTATSTNAYNDVSQTFSYVGGIHQIQIRDDYNRTRIDDVRFVDVLNYTTQISRMPLIEIARSDFPSGFQGLIHQEFMNEFQILHQGMVHNGQTPKKSIILEYANFIRSAGSLVTNVAT